MLKDYPEHIKNLQDDLIRVASRKHPGVDPFDVAIWVLESALETFISEARDELEAAEESGDAEAVAYARNKRHVFSAARADMGLLSDLKAYLSIRSSQ
ncbi:hypothetical protein EBB59_02995 [Lysobacter pythonis]|uniref:Uncharacterized protein n=1 Tax=Solilutibacter pythonis TaxID=2483112 RepID=A0A3M2HWW7_9GAMM|nr:hypothetical protein [Lysobacter pythonis]RMH94226.1 hypothetical protein EBB59_02995 [Lysobacter pythonis]